ncbi:hypothetical protein GEMRC1_011991 [Eukaryota sp. GEM-RC1]
MFEFAWQIEESSQELIDTARAGKCRFSHTHIKITASNNAGAATLPYELIERIFEAPRIYPEIPSAHADVYPWIASATGLFYFFPHWAEEYSLEEYDACLNVTECYDLLRGYISESTQLEHDGIPTFGPANILLVSDPKGRGIMLKNLIEAETVYNVSNHWDKSELDWAKHHDYLDVILDLGFHRSQINALFEMRNDIQDIFVKHPRIGICSDGGLPIGHPRSYGSFARIFDYYVSQRNLITLQQAIYKTTGLNAETYMIKDRGFVRPGYYADLILFNPEHVTQRAHFANPREMSVGFDIVLVNGKVALKDGKHQGNFGEIVRSYAVPPEV